MRVNVSRDPTGYCYPPPQKTPPAFPNACLAVGRHFGVQARALPVGLHPGAIRYFKEKGQAFE